MKAFLLVIVILIAVALYFTWRRGQAGQVTRLEDARAEAQRWYERLGGQVMNLHADGTAAQQALADASERYNAAGGQLNQASTIRQYELAKETALEGLAYVRAGRLAMGIDPGPEVPAPASAQGAGQLTKDREVDVQGAHYKAGPQPGADTPYYYPGGRVQGRPVPAGWYSQPIWRTALGAAGGAIAGMLIFDALFSPGFGDMGYGDGYQDAMGDMGGGDGGGGDLGGGDFGDFGGDF